ALLAALASERDICVEHRAFAATTDGRWPAGPSDLLLRIQLFREATRQRLNADTCRSLGLDLRAVRTVERARRQLAVAFGGRARDADAEGAFEADDAVLLRCTLAGFPDRLVRRRAAGSPRGLMVGGTGVVVDANSVAREAELFVAVDIDAGPQRALSE